MSIWQLHGKIPCGVQFFFYLWVDNRTDHLNILHLHGLHLRELLNWLVFWLVHHTRYRNRVHPLGTLFKVLKTSLLPFIARSIFRIIIFILSKTYFHRKTWLSGPMSALWASSLHAKVSFESSFSTSACISKTISSKVVFSPASFNFHPFGRIVSPQQSLNGRTVLG